MTTSLAARGEYDQNSRPPIQRERDRMKENLIEKLDIGTLREAIQAEYAEVAATPEKGFHFHTGRPLARKLEYADEWLTGIPESSIESFAGTGNPFSLGQLVPGERVVDVGCGAGIDSLIAAKKVGPEGRVIGVDMTPAMLEKARTAAREMGFENVEFREGFAEELPVDDGWADVVISNGVLNLMPDKAAALEEMARVLTPDGRLQIGDILVQKPVPESARRRIDLWTG
jgi:arsenite methyltransferase